MTLQSFVKSHLPPAPARVLEVGCGLGGLAGSIARFGYEVVAIDSNAPKGKLFERVSLENFISTDAFDAVVASRALQSRKMAWLLGFFRRLSKPGDGNHNPKGPQRRRQEAAWPDGVETSELSYSGVTDAR